MSHDLRAKIEALQANKKSTTDINAHEQDKKYASAGYARNVCFSLPTGQETFLNYAYLVAGVISNDDDNVQIQLTFTSHIVTMKGVGLHSLFHEFLDHIPRFVAQSETRYQELIDENEQVITQITIEQNTSQQ